MRTVALLVLTCAAACAGAPAPSPPPPAAPAPTPTLPAPGPPPSPVDAGAPEAGPTSAVGPSDPSQCATVVASGKVGAEEMRVCVSGPIRGSLLPSVVTRDARRVDEALLPFDARLGASVVKATFRDVTGDGLDDALAEGRAATDLECRFVVSGSTILDVLNGKARYRASASVGLSFAAAVAKGKHAGDPWAYAASVASPIPKAEACALVQEAQKSFASFKQVATDDVEIIDYPQPSLPFCLPKNTRRSATAKRLEGAEPIDCASMQCFDDASFCRNHEPDPSTDFYLFVKHKGRFKIRAIAYLRSAGEGS